MLLDSGVGCASLVRAAADPVSAGFGLAAGLASGGLASTDFASTASDDLAGTGSEGSLSVTGGVAADGLSLAGAAGAGTDSAVAAGGVATASLSLAGLAGAFASSGLVSGSAAMVSAFSSAAGASAAGRKNTH